MHRGSRCPKCNIIGHTGKVCHRVPQQPQRANRWNGNSNKSKTDEEDWRTPKSKKEAMREKEDSVIGTVHWKCRAAGCRKWNESRFAERCTFCRAERPRSEIEAEEEKLKEQKKRERARVDG